MVEHLLAKEKVASSNLVFRSKSFQKNLDMNEFLNQLDDNLRQFLSLGSNALDASRDITKDINFARSKLKKDGSLLTKYDLLVEEKIFEIGGGARFQSLYFYCQEDAFDMMDISREIVGKDINLQTLARGANVVGLESQSRDIINLHAKLFLIISGCRP